MQELEYGNNMLLFTTNWGQQETFKLMPIKDSCPFLEVIYDPSTTLLVVISKTSKQNFQNIPKLDANGSPVKATAPKKNGKPYQEERILMDVANEYYITEPIEQENFLKAFAVNYKTFDYGKFLRDMSKEPTFLDLEKQGLVDDKGFAIKK